jgi:Zn-dependent protease with chaperone function
MPGNTSEAAVRAMIARQRVRTRVLAGVAAGAMLLNNGIIVLIVAVSTRSVVAALAVPCAVVVAVAVTMAMIRRPGRRAGFMDNDDARQYLDRVEPAIARVAMGLHVAVPAARVIDDQALNALSVGSDRDGTIAYTSGLLDAVGDDQPLEAVTAHLLSRLACGDNASAVFSFGVLAWVLETFDVVMRLVRWLRRTGNGCLGFAFGGNRGFHGDEASFYARLVLFVFAVALGLELLAVALALFTVGGVLALVAVVTLKALARQRMRFADALAAELRGVEAVRAALLRLSDQPTELSRGGITLQDLCFAGPRPQRGDVKYTPDIQLRVAWLESGAGRRSTGLFGPVASAVTLTAALGGLGLAAANVPYGRPFGNPGGNVSGPPVALAQPPTSNPQTGSGLATTGSAPAPSDTSSGSGLASPPPTVSGSPGPGLPPPSLSPSPSASPPQPVPSPGPGNPAASYAQAVIADQPVAYWQFKDTAGSGGYADSSGHGNTLPAGATTLTHQGVRPGIGAISTANDGTFTSASLRPLTGDTSRTVEAWFKTTSPGCIFTAGSAAHAQAFSLCVRDGPPNSPDPGDHGFYLATWDADIFIPWSNITDGKWHYLALTLARNTVAVVVDGTEPVGYIWNGTAYSGIAPQPFALPYTPDTAVSRLGIGTHGLGDLPGGLEGTLAEIAVYPRAIPVPDLVRHYQLLAG